MVKQEEGEEDGPLTGDAHSSYAEDDWNNNCSSTGPAEEPEVYAGML